MNKTLVISTVLLNQAIADLERPHEFAFERIGFFICHNETNTFLSYDWFSLEDGFYVESEQFGALIGADGMQSIMQKAYSTQSGMFHFHLHNFQQDPTFSSVDLHSLRNEMIPSLYNFSQNGIHGGLIKGKKSFNGIYFIKGNSFEFNLTVKIGVHHDHQKQ